jgi:NADPH2:quinone reductase
MMRAIVVEEFGGPSLMEVRQQPIPEPGEGELSVDVAYAGVGFVDTLMRSGAVPLAKPFVPGIEVAGTVRALGAGVEGLRVGQPVAALLNDFGRAPRLGGYAEVAVAHDTLVVPVREEANLAAVAAALANGTAAWFALHQLAGLKPSDRVLVLGAARGIGATACRIAALLAGQVIGVVSGDPSRAPRECTDVVLAAELDERLPALTDDGTVDVVVDPVGGVLRETAFEHLAPLGRHLLLGDASGEDRPLSGDAAWIGSRTVAGLNLAGIADLQPDSVHEALATVVSLVEDGSLREPAPAIEPFESAAAVHAAIEDRTAPAKTLLAP